MPEHDGIPALDAADGVFIGPADLAADMGHLGNAAEPAVRAAVLDALRRIRAAGKAAGVLATRPDFAESCREAGAKFLGVCIDVTVFAGALRDLARRWRG